jgi:Protein of unknown function (DUF4239)
MDFYWLYDIPTWALFLLITGTVLTISLIGAFLLRQRFDAMLGLSEKTNEIVGHFLSFTGAFYGIMLGLVAVGAWDIYKDAKSATEQEAANLAALYFDVMQLPAPIDGRGQAHLRNYAKVVIETEWPQQRMGQISNAGDYHLHALAIDLGMTDSTQGNTKLLLAEALGQYNRLLQARRLRLQTTSDALPASLWVVITIGAFINICMTWLLYIKSSRLDLVVNTLMALTLGTVLSFIIAMDNPYRGELSVSAEEFENVYVNVMDGALPDG